MKWKKFIGLLFLSVGFFLLQVNLAQAIIVGFNDDLHMDIPGAIANDFHIEGRIESGMPGSNWSKPPVLVAHIDDRFPDFNYSIVPDTSDPGQNWYIFKADWKGADYQYCQILHLGLFFDVDCHNIVVDLKGWWTFNGEPVPPPGGPPTPNGGNVPVPGFNVIDKPPEGSQIYEFHNDAFIPDTGQPQQEGIVTEIVEMHLAMVPDRSALAELLGDNPFAELRLGGREEALPWIPVEPFASGQTIPVPPGGILPVILTPDDISLVHPVEPIEIPPGGFLVAKELIKFTNNNGEPDFRWVWHLHEAHAADLGDAPDSTNTSGSTMTAYPKGGPLGVKANYPTVYLAGSPPYGPLHRRPDAVAFLGQGVSKEMEADIGPDADGINNIIPPQDKPDLDNLDDGVLNMPLALPKCTPTTFNYLVNIVNIPVTNAKLYVNVWFDWNRDGDWDDTLNCADGTSAPEWAVQNQILTGLTVGIHSITTPQFIPWHPDGAEEKPIWMRITLAEQPAPIGVVGTLGYGGAGPIGGYDIGETEDYYFRPRTIVPTQACCFDDGTCANLTPEECRRRNGQPKGAGTVCQGDNNHNGIDDICEVQTPVACCLPDGTCADIPLWECLQQQGFPQGPGSNCANTVCPLIKWAQPPVLNPDSVKPACFWGWDEPSLYRGQQLVADDFPCETERPITDIHWWGSYIFWGKTAPPQIAPQKFHIAIWTDVPASADNPFSHPGKMIWQWTVDRSQLNEQPVGCDFHPEYMEAPDTCFRYDFIIPEDEWFWQGPENNIYWISISAIYLDLPEPPNHPWGWKTRPLMFQDSAVIIAQPNTPNVGDTWEDGGPIAEGWDLAFVLTTRDVQRWDFGDAPDPTYPTLLASNGARHKIVPGVFLGTGVDADQDGQPHPQALGDDNDGNDDEDGIMQSNPLIPGKQSSVDIQCSVAGYVDGWIDFNADGDWDDSGEHILQAVFCNPLGVPPTSPTHYFQVPPDAKLGPTFARFRFTTLKGGLPYKGPAEDGEVEDYLFNIIEPEVIADLGDAPDSTNNHAKKMTAYPWATTAHFPTVYQGPIGGAPLPPGPIHWKPLKVAYLGPSVSLEEEADIGYDQDTVNNIDPPNNAADQDKFDDGVLFPLNLPQCSWSRFKYLVNVVTPGTDLYVNVWFDWNRDGDWDDVLDCPRGAVPEWAVQNQLLIGLPAGLQTITTPAFLAWHPGGDRKELWMRITLAEKPWRYGGLSTTPAGFGGAGPAGGYQYGETEDYIFIPKTECLRCPDLNCDQVVNLLDFLILAGKWMGSCP